MGSVFYPHAQSDKMVPPDRGRGEGGVVVGVQGCFPVRTPRNGAGGLFLLHITQGREASCMGTETEARARCFL